MRARWGGIYNAKIAARMKRPYLVPTRAGKCPLCGQDDGATHILGECPAHKHLHIERHNKVGRCILSHMRRGALGAFQTFADIGKESQLEVDYSVTAKCLPVGMVPPPIVDAAPQGQASARHDVDRTYVSKFDILVVHTRNALTPASQWQELPANTAVTSIEIGFRSDFDGGRKYSQKLD